MKKLLLLPVCVLVLCMTVPASFVFAEEELSSEVSCGGIITAIQRQGLLSSIPPLVFYSNEDSSTLDACVQEYRQMLASVVATVDENGTSAEMPLTVCWSGPDVDLSSPGLYQMTGDILAPDGYTFAEGVITQIIVPFQIKSADEVYPITLIANQNLCDGGIMLALNDIESWNEAIDDLHYMATTMYGLTEDEQPAYLEVVSIDDTLVDLSVPGEYEIIITLAVSEENKVSFSLPEHLQKIRVPVKISDPDAFELWITKYDNDSFSFDYLKKLDSSFKLYTLESETELSPDELPTADWSVDTNGSLNVDANCMSVLRRNLTVGHYYYYQIRSDSCSSTIVMLQDNGEKCSYASIGGNRDGSSDNPGADDVIQPAPTAPAETPSQPETTAPMESFTEDSDTIYGTRLDLSRKNHGGSASFSKHDIQATLSSDTLDSLDIGASDSLTVEIKQETPSSVTISVSKNGETVAEIPDTRITAPVNGKLYSFTVQETGTYELPEREVDSESTIHTSELPPSDPSGGLFNRNGLPFYLGLSALSLGGSFLILRRRIFR
ncbi:hypothetical protein [Hominiventricola filiformis]|uniref:Bacterial repeat domain-containing protein n=1 Tax=Hominiventricola filiformis TaxID=2885352 RepID=A0AAE3DAE6_9FIRM|nr:hypothetical protein [Hominiventricola filiformis]MCC2125722.1 hypothetical protein [Hominiventricola filiformis]